MYSHACSYIHTHAKTYTWFIFKQKIIKVQERANYRLDITINKDTLKVEYTEMQDWMDDLKCKLQESEGE